MLKKCHENLGHDQCSKTRLKTYFSQDQLWKIYEKRLENLFPGQVIDALIFFFSPGRYGCQRISFTWRVCQVLLWNSVTVFICQWNGRSWSTCRAARWVVVVRSWIKHTYISCDNDTVKPSKFQSKFARQNFFLPRLPQSSTRRQHCFSG